MKSEANKWMIELSSCVRLFVCRCRTETRPIWLINNNLIGYRYFKTYVCGGGGGGSGNGDCDGNGGFHYQILSYLLLVFATSLSHSLDLCLSGVVWFVSVYDYLSAGQMHAYTQSNVKTHIDYSDRFDEIRCVHWQQLEFEVNFKRLWKIQCEALKKNENRNELNAVLIIESFFPMFTAFSWPRPLLLSLPVCRWLVHFLSLLRYHPIGVQSSSSTNSVWLC